MYNENSILVNRLSPASKVPAIAVDHNPGLRGNKELTSGQLANVRPASPRATLAPHEVRPVPSSTPQATCIRSLSPLVATTDTLATCRFSL